MGKKLNPPPSPNVGATATTPSTSGAVTSSSAEKTLTPSQVYRQLLSVSMALVHRGVVDTDDRHVVRMLRHWTTMRRKCDFSVLFSIWDRAVGSCLYTSPEDSKLRESIKAINDAYIKKVKLCAQEQNAGTDSDQSSNSNPSAELSTTKESVPESLGSMGLSVSQRNECLKELDLFLTCLLLVYLIDCQKNDMALAIRRAKQTGEQSKNDDTTKIQPKTSFTTVPSSSTPSSSMPSPSTPVLVSVSAELTLRLSQTLIQRLLAKHCRNVDSLIAKVVFYYHYADEINHTPKDISGFANTRPILMRLFRTACVHEDVQSHATLLNLLLRNYLHCNLYDMAFKLVSKTSFPESLRSNAQLCRYLFYIGRILAVQLEYSESHTKLMQALRKAPQHNRLARGFRLAVTKMAIVVELLMGEIPDRSLFNTKEMRQELEPYHKIVLAVRGGDLKTFTAVVDQHVEEFTKDGSMFLIGRLHHNVIRAGLRMINVSYSRIALADIAKKLGLNSPEDAECIVAKAIHDGVIEATINHDGQFLESKSNIDVYGTSEPIKAFHKRITFCLQLHSDAVKAMQYPDESSKGRTADGEESEEQRKALQEEIMRAEDDDIGDDMDML